MDETSWANVDICWGWMVAQGGFIILVSLLLGIFEIFSIKPFFKKEISRYIVEEEVPVHLSLSNIFSGCHA